MLITSHEIRCTGPNTGQAIFHFDDRFWMQENLCPKKTKYFSPKEVPVLQIVTGHQSLSTIWVSWLLKIDADFLK